MCAGRTRYGRHHRRGDGAWHIHHALFKDTHPSQLCSIGIHSSPQSALTHTLRMEKKQILAKTITLATPSLQQRTRPSVIANWGGRLRSDGTHTQTHPTCNGCIMEGPHSRAFWVCEKDKTNRSTLTNTHSHSQADAQARHSTPESPHLQFPI